LTAASWGRKIPDMATIEQEVVPATFGDFLYQERKKHGDSREFLAVLFGVSYKSIRNWEKNVYPMPLNAFFTLADRYGWDVDWVSRIAFNGRTQVA
jgi:transcriptional regulator with XRE-family HTH domain